MNDLNQKGLILINLGQGKGKTTAALGTAVRALGQGLKVAFFQFIKKRETGESKFLSALAENKNYHLVYMKSGAGFVGAKPGQGDIQAAEIAFKEACEIAAEVDLLVLDEMGAVLKNQLLKTPRVYEFALNKPAHLSLILTGREFPPEFIELADTVTEMTLIKHAYKQGIDARAGIEF